MCSLAERVARRDTNSGGFYYFSDRLKTASVETDASGNIKDESDFYSWGGELRQRTRFRNWTRFNGVRYYDSALGRFMTPDPIIIMRQRMRDPQQWNMYAYPRNNPLRFVDNKGKWPTEVHERIVDRAFPGLSDKQRSSIKSASYWMDHCATCQSKGNSYQHSMRAPNQDPAQANNRRRTLLRRKKRRPRRIREECPVRRVISMSNR
jgi:RHS repeat-associated protein